jgi:hypothetical protein
MANCVADHHSDMATKDHLLPAEDCRNGQRIEHCSAENAAEHMKFIPQ